MANRSETMFSEREIRYLRSLPAVQSVTQKRIRYTKAFRDDCIRRYRNGESPVEIFRKAGLDSSLIGYKRIERCMARWRDEPDGPEPRVDAMQPTSFDIPEDERWVGSGTPPTGDARYGRERDARLDSDTRFAYELVITQQARRIDELERKIRRLEHRLDGTGEPSAG